MKTVPCANNDCGFCPGWFRENILHPEWSNQACSCLCHNLPQNGERR